MKLFCFSHPEVCPMPPVPPCLGRPRARAPLRWANTQLMTRTAATSAMVYGADVQGISNTLLTQQTSTIARLSAPEGGGKNPIKTLYLLDGPNGSLDPTFDAHALPVKHWAMAWWQSWQLRVFPSFSSA